MLDFDRVNTYFRQLSDCCEEDLDNVKILVRSAVNAIDAALDKNKAVGEAVTECEYAAACSALYDYVCRESSREQMTLTAAGNADNNADFTHRLKGALELKNEAMQRIERYMLDSAQNPDGQEGDNQNDDFVFRAV